MTQQAQRVTGFDEGTAAKFLARYFAQVPATRLALVKGIKKRPGPGFGTTRDLWAQDSAQALWAARTHYLAGADVYVGICPRKERSGKDTAALPGGWLAADLDVGNVGHSSPSRWQTEAEALSALDSLPPAHLVIASGGGLQAWWMLYGVCLDLGDWQEAQSRIVQALGSDPCTIVPTCVLRVPGTVNTKTGQPRPVRVLVDRDHEETDIDAFLKLETTARLFALPSGSREQRAGGGSLDAAPSASPALPAPRAVPPPLPPAASGPRERAGDLAKRVGAVEVARWLGLGPKQIGGTWRSRCPMHGGENPSSLVLGGSNPHAATCFSGCAAGPNRGVWTAVDLVMRERGLAYVEAVTWIGERAGFEGFRPRAAGASSASARPLEPSSPAADPASGGQGVGEREGQGRPEPDRDPIGADRDPAEDQGDDDGPPSGGRGGAGDGPPPRRHLERRTIQIGMGENCEHLIADEALEALVEHEVPIYARGGQLVMIRNDVQRARKRQVSRARGEPVICELKLPQVRRYLSQTCDFVTKTERENKKTGETYFVDESKHVPEYVPKDLHTRGEWEGLRELVGFTECPTLRRDGSVISAPGYDEQTGLYFSPSITFEGLPETVQRGAALAAIEKLKGLVVDFPFETPAHRAAWLAGLLTPMARYAWGETEGVAPMFLIDANESGSGKGLLLEVIGLILFGRQPPAMPQANNPEEERKNITTNLKEGSPMIVIDNIRKTLGGANMEVLLTLQTWSDRLLGGNDTAKLPNNAIWFGTGNQIKTTPDMVRRVIYVRLKSEHERPADRQDFQIRDLRRHVRERRAELATAAASVLVAWMQHRQGVKAATGRDPAEDLSAWSSYPGWSDVVRGALVWLGEPDPVTAGAGLGEDNEEAALLADLHLGWMDLDPTGAGMSAAELVTRLRDDFDDHGRLTNDARAPLLAGLAWLTGGQPDRLPAAGKLGYALRRVRDRVAQGRRLVRAVGADGQHVARWTVEAVVVPPRVPPSSGPNGGHSATGDGSGDVGRSFSSPDHLPKNDATFQEMAPASNGISRSSPDASPAGNTAAKATFREIGRSFLTSYEESSFSGVSGAVVGPEIDGSRTAQQRGDLHPPISRSASEVPPAPSPLALPSPPAQPAAGEGPPSPDLPMADQAEIDAADAAEAEAIREYGGG